MDADRLPPPGPGRRTARSALYAIVYTSTASRAVDPGDMAQLLEGARRRNQQEGVTGVLLYSDGCFMQYLEGPAHGLGRVYDVVKTHPLHYGLIDLVREPVPQRQFAEWSMAFQIAGAFGRAEPAQQDTLLARRLDTAAQPASVACELLAAFWLKGRGSLPSALHRHSHARAQAREATRLDTGTHD